MPKRQLDQTDEAAGDLLAASFARRYATLGWALVRADGKRPIGEGWEKTQAQEPGFAAGQWSRWGDRWNLGVVLGPSHLVVVEFDTDAAGKILAGLLEHELPLTPIVQSGSGRLHLYFRDTGATHATRDGLELRAGAHLMIVPPSRHPNGTPYKWLLEPETRLADVPAAVLAFFGGDPRRNGTAPIGAPIPNGERNRRLASLAGSMRRRGMGEPAILAALREVPCETPLPERELAAIAHSISRYQPAGVPGTAAISWQRLSQVDLRSIVFVDKPLWQADAFHLVAGRKGQGKGTLLSLLTADVTLGKLGPKRNVVWIASEDSAAVDIGPRLQAAGAELERVLIVAEGWIQLPRDIPEIKRAIGEMGDVALVIVDPVGNHIAGKNSDSEEIREAIGPLNKLADDHQCMVVGVRHLSEKEAKNGIVAAILGASAWAQVPRAVIAVVQDDEDPQLRHVQCVTGNRLPPGTPGRMFRIDGVMLPGFENEVTRATWAGESVKDLDAILAKNREPSKTENARELILDILESEGEQESDTLDARVARATGLAARTVRDARLTLGKDGLVKSQPDKDELGTILCWKVYRSGAPRE